jgi:predicted dehydrogenase
MITTVEEAQRLIAPRDQSCSPVMVGFQGALSPLVADTQASRNS